MEATGVGFVSGIGDLVVQKLAAYLEQEVKLIVGMNEDLRFIKDEIAMATALLNKKSTIDKNSNEGVWLKQVRELIYEAEDVLDECTYHIIARGGRRRNSSNSNSRLGSLVVRISSTLVHMFHLLRTLKARRRIASQLSKLKLKAEDVKERRFRYITFPVEGVAATRASDVIKRYDGTSPDSRFRALSADTDQLVGIAHQRDEIIQWLVDTTVPQLRVISIVGPGGMGKTTLAMQCYHSPKVTGGELFPCRAQVTVSQSFDLDKLFRNLLKKFTSIDSKAIDEVELVNDIKEHLKDKSYLVLLDDVWTQDAWNNLKKFFPDNGNGSRIIVTTRNEEVASACSTSNPGRVHRIQPLLLEQSRELFCKRVFCVHPFSCPPNLEELMEGILKKCGGMPLAIVTIAGILVSNSQRINSREHWQRVHDGIGHEWEDGAKSMRQVLMLSYNDLPDDVKPCFLYLSVLPEDYPFKRPNIMRRWIAEGLVVSNRSGEAEEEVAKSSFDQLVSRNLIYPANVVWGEVKEWRIHDMIHDIIVRKAIDESFVCIINNKDDVMVRRRPSLQGYYHQYSNSKIRRISIRELEVDDLSLPVPLDLSLVRSLSFFFFRHSTYEARSGGMLTNFKEMRLVRMLHLGGCLDIQDHHVEQICESLLLLKYLDLSSTGITKLPESIGLLQHLEVLDIREISWLELPQSFIKLRRLTHLYAGSGVQLPRGLGVSSMGASLRVLKLGKINKDNIGSLEELGGGGQLVRLQALHIVLKARATASQDLLKEKLRAALGNGLGNSLRSLKLEVDWPKTPAVGLLDDLSLPSPPLKLESLRLTGMSLHTRIPSWIASLRHVAKMILDLHHVVGVQYFMEHLGNSLQSLVILRLRLALLQSLLSRTSRNAGDGDLIIISIGPEQGFSRLRILALLFDRHEGIQIIFRRGALQNLEFLCHGRGNSFHHLRGVGNLAQLKQISCSECNDLEVLRAAVEAHPNKPKLTTYPDAECICIIL